MYPLTNSRSSLDNSVSNLRTVYNVKIPFKYIEQIRKNVSERFSKHPWWDQNHGWKNLLNYLHLNVQHMCSFQLN